MPAGQLVADSRHALVLTTEPDLLAWAIILWFLVKLLAGGDGRLWLAAGITAGIGLENKSTFLSLGAGLAVGSAGGEA